MSAAAAFVAIEAEPRVEGERQLVAVADAATSAAIAIDRRSAVRTDEELGIGDAEERRWRVSAAHVEVETDGARPAGEAAKNGAN